MELAFAVGGERALFARNDMTGRATLQVGEDVRLLASPWRPSTHVEFKTRHVWTERFGEHTVEVEKRRPRMWGGLRANTFLVRVDGLEVAQGTGN